MQRTTSSDTDLSRDDLARLIRRAEITRAQNLRENSGSILRAIGWSALAFGFLFLIVARFGSPPHQIRENTEQMEQLATKLSPMDTIAPGTLGEIAGLLRRPDYDCREVRCDTALEKRNAAARRELERILAKHFVPAALAVTK